mmetsp:Transcript_58022/g.168333  ORF Transcript_58022/g.168333 Transcript_58022/m.168333 type:complete len:408 (+) Transcript_58022:229-1452(+)
MTDFACKSLPFAAPPLRKYRSRDGTPRRGADVRHLYQKLSEGGVPSNGAYSGLPQHCGEELEESPSSPAASKDDDSDAESLHYYEEGFSLDQDLYGVSIASFLRDMRKVIIERGNLCLRISRLVVTILMMLMLVALQFYLVIMMKVKVCPAGIEHMQDLYDKYEVHMYSGHASETADGHFRGIDGFFDAKRFETLEPDFQEEICAIPLTHPVFFSTMLLIWTFTVVADVRRLHFLMLLFIKRIPEVQNVYDIFEHDEGEQHGRPRRNEDKRVVLVGLPTSVKCALFIFVFLPRLILDFALLWLGCRWLMSTDNLEDVFLNAVALEFILYLKELLYYAVVPMRSQVESQELLIIPLKSKERATFGAYLGAFVWLVISIAWVPFYLFVLQRVLPGFKWDVGRVCAAYGH